MVRINQSHGFITFPIVKLKKPAFSSSINHLGGLAYSVTDYAVLFIGGTAFALVRTRHHNKDNDIKNCVSDIKTGIH